MNLDDYFMELYTFEDYLYEKYYLDSEKDYEYKMWLEEQQNKIKPITKVEIREEKPEIILDGVENKHQ